MWKLIQKRRDEQGYALGLALFAMFVLGFVSLLLMSFATTVGGSTATLLKGKERLRIVDAAMKQVVSDLRMDKTGANKACSTSNSATAPYYMDIQETLPLKAGQTVADTKTVRVGCEVDVVSTSQRIFVLKARILPDDDTHIIGQARVRYVDKVGPYVDPGYSMYICDWILGRSATAPASCP